jgi:hypothetical protein
MANHDEIQFYVGAAPEIVSASGAPKSDADANLIALLLNSAKKISFSIDCGSKEQAEPLKLLGPSFSNVTELQVVFDDICDDAVLSLLTRAKNLRRLTLPWGSDTGRLLAVVSPQLERLTLSGTPDADVDLPQLFDVLKGMKNLTALFVHEACGLIMTMQGESMSGQLAPFKINLHKLSDGMPESLKSLGGVFIQSEELCYLVDVPLFAYFFAKTPSKKMCQFLEEKIVEVGIDKASCEKSNTAFEFLLISQGTPEFIAGDSIDFQEKLERLILAGANPLRLFEFPGFFLTAGSMMNSFHLAAMFCDEYAMVEFLEVMARGNYPMSPVTMRSSEGFTPLHLGSRCLDAWESLNEHFLQSSWPEMLTDTDNIIRSSALTALYRRVDVAESPNEVMDIGDAIMKKEPWANSEIIQKEKHLLFPFVLDFYAFHASRNDLDDELYSEGHVDKVLESLYIEFSGDRVTTPGASLDIAAQRLQLALSLSRDVVQRGNKDFSLGQRAISEATIDELSAGLIVECVHKIDPRAVKQFLDAGAKVSFAHAFFEGKTALLTLVRLQTPNKAGRSEEEEVESTWSDDCRDFWEAFWLLVNAGATSSHTIGEREHSIFTYKKFARFLKEEEDQEEEVKKLRKWLTDSGATTELEKFEAIFSGDLPSGADSEDDSGDGSGEEAPEPDASEEDDEPGSDEEDME